MSNLEVPDSAHVAEPKALDLEKSVDSPRDSLDDNASPDSTGGPLTKVVTAQDWTGKNDPENPQNWPFAKKAYHTLAIALLAFACTFGTSVYTPAYPEVMERFGVSSTAALLPLSLYTLGLAFGPMISAPISETMGRRIVYFTSVPLCMLFVLGSGFAQSFATLCVCRFFGGFFGSPVLAVGAGSNADMWSFQSRAVASAFFIMSPFLGPAFGPPVGGYTVMYKSWRWTQWDALFVSLPCYAFGLGMSETYKKVILQKRAKRLGIQPPKDSLTGLAKMKFILLVTLGRPLVMLFTEPIVAFFSIYVAFNFAVLYAFFAAFPIVFEGIYHFNPGESGLTFCAVALGVVLGGALIMTLDRTIYRKKFALHSGEKGTIAPEHRLYPAMVGSIGLPIGLFWFAWTSRADVHWISPVLAAVPFSLGNTAIFISAMLYMIDTYGPLLGASAAAANGLLRYVFGAAFPLFTIQMFTKLHVDWATSLFGFVSLALLPIPWVLFKFGARVRAKSGYEAVRNL